MATEIKCEKWVIREVFKAWYCIPHYQRPYLWSEEQVLQLLEDTMTAYLNQPDTEYFLGSMVLRIQERKDPHLTYTEYELLDGQQRLTTLFLLFAVVRDLPLPPELDSKEKNAWAQLQDACHKAVFQEKNLFENQPERFRIVFDKQEALQLFIEQYIQTSGASRQIDALDALANSQKHPRTLRNLAVAMRTLQRFFDQHQTQLLGYLIFLLHKVILIAVATETLHDAFRIFTVMNSRGLQLSSSDILKAMNLKAISSENEHRRYAKQWDEMADYFGEDFEQFLSCIRSILLKRKATGTLMNEFETQIYKSHGETPALLQKGKETFHCLYDYYNIYTALFDNRHDQHEGNFAIDNYLCLMRAGLAGNGWICALLYYVKRFGNTELSTFLQLLDKKVSADWLTGLSPSKRQEAIYAILREIAKANQPKQLFLSPVFAVDFFACKAVIRGKVYGKAYARYLLMKLDLLYQGHDALLQPPTLLSIEHILPRSPHKESQWRRDFTDEAQTQWTDRLGNLTLISRRKNARLSNLDFQKKMQGYFRHSIEPFPNSIRIYQQYQTWTLGDLQDNHETVCKCLQQTYRK